MTLEEAIAAFRVDTDDLEAPYLSSDAQVTAWLAEAQDEAAVRANLLFEAANAAMCEIAITAGVMTYPLHKAIAAVTYAEFTPTGTTDTQEVKLNDRFAMDRDYPGWRTKTDRPYLMIVDQTSMQMGCKPSTDGTLRLECYRLPTTSLEDSEQFEIAAAHHRHLIQWALHKCYSRPDAEVHDAGRADKALMEFTRVFGIRPDAELRRNFYSNTPQHNQAYW